MAGVQGGGFVVALAPPAALPPPQAALRLWPFVAPVMEPYGGVPEGGVCLQPPDVRHHIHNMS
jgi:hypothetical protein